MKKIASVVYKETFYIALVCSLLSVLMEAVFLILDFWSLDVLFGNVFGLMVVVLNFFLMALSVQKAVEKDEKGAKDTLRLSQSGRFLMLIVCAVVAYSLDFINVIAFIIPYLFPRIAIALRPVLVKEKEEK